MATTGRYVYCPMTSKRLTMRVSVAERIMVWFRRRNMDRSDVYTVTGYFPPITPARRGV